MHSNGYNDLVNITVPFFIICRIMLYNTLAGLCCSLMFPKLFILTCALKQRLNIVKTTIFYKLFFIICIIPICHKLCICFYYIYFLHVTRNLIHYLYHILHANNSIIILLITLCHKTIARALITVVLCIIFLFIRHWSS